MSQMLEVDKLKVFSMFTGIGGFDLAFRNLGHEIVGACEIDKYARDIYSRHFPDVKIYNDATKMSPESLPPFDVLCAGFPCQTFSIAGKRAGFDDPRGNLFFEIARIAKEKRPRYLLLENVKGLLSHDQGETFRVIISTLDEMGYDAEWQVLNSKYFVPQNRERIFIIGHLRGERTRQIFPLGDIKDINVGTCQETQGEGEWIRGQYTGSIDANYAKGGGSRTMIAWSKSHRTGKLDSDKRRHNYGKIEERVRFNEANCLNTGDGCRTMSSATYVMEDKNIRALTPLECERLQGFPDNWTEGISDTQRYKCCGNAVTVPVIEYIVKHFIEVDDI